MASTTPVMATVVPMTVPRATLLRSSRFSTIPKARSSNSMPVKTTATRNSEIAHRLAMPTRWPMSFSALYTRTAMPSTNSMIGITGSLHQRGAREAATRHRLSPELDPDGLETALVELVHLLVVLGGDEVSPRPRRFRTLVQDFLEVVVDEVGALDDPGAETDVPALVAQHQFHALAHPRHRYRQLLEGVEQRVLPGREDHALEDHVVEPDRGGELLVGVGEAAGDRGQTLLEQLEEIRAHPLAQDLEPLVEVLPGDADDLADHAVEEAGVPGLVAGLRLE